MEENYWTRSLRTRMSRRRLLKGLALGGAGVALLSPTLGCQQQTAKPDSGTSSSEPKYGGTLIQFNAGPPQPNLDPILASGLTIVIDAGVYSGLLRRDFKETTKIIPDLAERYEVTPDGLTYKFYLRKDVLWHDGKPFTAADCQSTYDRLKDKSFMASSGWGKRMARIVDSWKTIDDYTFQLNFQMPAPYLLSILSSNTSKITPRHIIEKEGSMEKTWIGTGPFKLVKYEPGAVLEFVKNDNFFRKGLPYLDGIKKPIITDRSAQIAAMASGQSMIGVQWPALMPSEIELIKKQMGDKIEVVETYQGAPQKIDFQPGFAATSDPKVRRAIFLAIDRWDIAARVFEGAGEVGTILDSRIYGDWALPVDEVQKLPGIRKDKTEDLAMAKKLLAEAGYANGLEIQWKVRNTADYIPVAQVVAAQLDRIGIKSTIKSLDMAAGTQEINNGEWQMGSSGGMFASHGLEVLQAFIIPSTFAKFNSPWAPKEYMDLYNEAMTTLDVAKAKKLAHDMQRYLLTKDTPWFPVNWFSAPVGVSKKLHGYYPSNTGFNEGHDHTIEWLEP